MNYSKKHITFLIVGGNIRDQDYYRSLSLPSNFLLVGHVDHSSAKKLMTSCDILLMPYQKSVSIGVGNHDTSRWMSPLKMFEYMSSSTPFISSDLPVLKEILANNRNCLLVPPDSIDDWSYALKTLLENPDLQCKLSSAAYRDVELHYTWTSRAKRLLAS